MALDLMCINCGDQMSPEHAHNTCRSCGHIEPCCDGVGLPCTVYRDGD